MDRMRTFIAFVALCIVAASARTVYDKYRYQSGSSLGGSLGSLGGSYMRSSRMGGSYLGGSMYSTDSPYRTQYRGYSGNLYNNNYDDNFGLGSKLSHTTLKNFFFKYIDYITIKFSTFSVGTYFYG